MSIRLSREKSIVDFYVGSGDIVASGLIGEEKIAELSLVTKKLLMHTLDDEEVFSIIENSLKSLKSSVKAIQEVKSPADQDGLLVRSPLQIKSKGRSRQSIKRYRSMAEATNEAYG